MFVFHCYLPAYFALTRRENIKPQLGHHPACQVPENKPHHNTIEAELTKLTDFGPQDFQTS